MVQYYTHLFIDHTCKLRIFKYIIKKKKLIDRERKRGLGVRRQDRLAQNWVSNTKSQHIGEWARIQSPNSSSPHLFSALGYIYIYIYISKLTELERKIVVADIWNTIHTTTK